MSHHNWYQLTVNSGSNGVIVLHFLQLYFPYLMLARVTAKEVIHTMKILPTEFQSLAIKSFS